MNLREVFNSREPQITAKLERAASLSEVADVLIAELDAVEAHCRPTLTAPQSRIVLPQFDTVRQFLRTAGNVAPPPSAVPSPKEKFRLFGHLDVFLGRLLFLQSSSRPPTQTARPSPIGYRPLRSHVVRALETIEQTICETTPPAEADTSKFVPMPPSGRHVFSPQSDHDLLEFLQNLYADAQDNDGKRLIKRVRELPRVLDNYQIEIVLYTPESQPRINARQAFQFEEVSGAENKPLYTLLPALISGDTVLVKGLVVAED